METTIDSEQERLLRTLVEAARRGATERPDFVWYEQPLGSRPTFRNHPGLRENLSVAKGDLQHLAALGLLTERNTTAGIGNITLTRLAFDSYDEWNTLPPPP